MEVVLKCHLCIAARHGPGFAGSLHLPGSVSSTAEVVAVAGIVRETIE